MFKDPISVRVGKHEMFLYRAVYEAIGRVNTGVPIVVSQAVQVEFKRPFGRTFR